MVKIRNHGKVILHLDIYIKSLPEKAMATHSSTLAWKIPWTEKPGRLQSMGSLNWTWLSDFTFTFHFHAWRRKRATHSSVLAWRISGTAEPGRLPSMGSRRVGHDWCDLVAAAAKVYYSLLKIYINLGLTKWVRLVLKTFLNSHQPCGRRKKKISNLRVCQGLETLKR